MRELRFLSVALAIQLRVGVRRRLMRVVLPRFPMEVDRRIPRIVGRRRGPGGLALKAFETRPRLEHRAVDREMLVRHQPGVTCLIHHRVEEGAGDIRGQQSVAILTERRRRQIGSSRLKPMNQRNKML